MRHAFLLALFALTYSFACAQTLDNRIAELWERDAYAEIIDLAGGDPALNDTSLYRIGRSLFHLDQDSLALGYFRRVTGRNPKYANAWYFQSQAANYSGDSVEALRSIDRALALDPGSARYWSTKGDTYYAWQTADSALVFYRHATTLPECPHRAYMMIGNLLTEADQHAEALVAFQLAKTKTTPETDAYQRCLFNIGTLEYVAGRYAEAQTSLEELLRIAPRDYAAVTKLIQVYYARQNYAAGDALKPMLYTAYRDGKLPERLRDDFCIDQFEWNGQTVAVYERYAEKGALYYKYVFYLFDAQGKTELTVQTESSMAIRMGDYHYVLGMDKGRKHYTYIQYQFPKTPDYAALKKGVIAVLEGAKPSSSSGKN